MRLYDFKISQKPDILIANSDTIKQRIQKFYRRDAVVIHPPIDLAEFEKIKKESGNYYLSLSRLDPDKNIALVIETFSKNGLPLKIVGTGREEQKLKKLAGKNIHFLGKVSDKERIKLLANAKALILAASHEDFGITSIESQAAGTPVIALHQGGYKETVIENKTGVFFGERKVGSLQLAINKFEKHKFNIEDLKKNVRKFSKEEFKKNILRLIEKEKNKV